MKGVRGMDIPEGVNRWRTKQGLTVVRVHYTADPAKRSAAWQAEQRRGMSAAMWERVGDERAGADGRRAVGKRDGGVVAVRRPADAGGGGDGAAGEVISG
jgi:hypothetical protein